VVWSRLDQMVVPQRNGRLIHPDLDVEELELRDVGHLSMPIDTRTLHWVADALTRSDHRYYRESRGQERPRPMTGTLGESTFPAS
jgi:triacylglycerol lipase